MPVSILSPVSPPQPSTASVNVDFATFVKVALPAKSLIVTVGAKSPKLNAFPTARLEELNV